MKYIGEIYDRNTGELLYKAEAEVDKPKGRGSAMKLAATLRNLERELLEKTFEVKWRKP